MCACGVAVVVSLCVGQEYDWVRWGRLVAGLDLGLRMWGAASFRGGGGRAGQKTTLDRC